MSTEFPTLPDLGTLEAWLAAREDRLPDLRPEARSEVTWGPGGPGVRAPWAVVVLSGYTALKDEVTPLPRLVAEGLGAHLYRPRTPGTGQGVEAYRRVRSRDWKAGAEEALAVGRLLGERVLVMGTSTGGTLASWLILSGRGAGAAAVVLVSPNLQALDRHSELLRLPGGRLWAQWALGSVVERRARNPLHARGWDLRYHSASLVPLVRLAAEVRGLDFRRWDRPVLVWYDPLDQTVDEAVTVKKFSLVPPGLADLRRWDALEGDDHHVLAGDALAPGGTAPLAEGTLRWLKTVFGPEG